LLVIKDDAYGGATLRGQRATEHPGLQRAWDSHSPPCLLEGAGPDAMESAVRTLPFCDRGDLPGALENAVLTSFLTLTRFMATGFAVLVLATNSAAAAPIDDDPDPSPVAVLDAFVDAFNTRALDRAQALPSNNAIIADERGEYAGGGARQWLVRASNDGIRIRLLGVPRIDTDERGSPGHSAWWLSFTVALSWRMERDLGFAPHVSEASAILGGSVIHSFRLQRLGGVSEPSIMHVPPTEPPGESGLPSLLLVAIVTAGVAVVGAFVYRRRGRTRPRIVASSQLRLLYPLHQATLHRREARRRCARVRT
jgi:hypothetical protein